MKNKDIKIYNKIKKLDSIRDDLHQVSHEQTNENKTLFLALSNLYYRLDETIITLKKIINYEEEK